MLLIYLARGNNFVLSRSYLCAQGAATGENDPLSDPFEPCVVTLIICRQYSSTCYNRYRSKTTNSLYVHLLTSNRIWLQGYGNISLHAVAGQLGRLIFVVSLCRMSQTAGDQVNPLNNSGSLTRALQVIVLSTTTRKSVTIDRPP